MPEWPEVTLTSRALHDLCAGKSITAIKIVYALRFHAACAAQIIANQLPIKVEKVHNKGKNIIFTLDKDGTKYCLISHMMLTGSWSTIKNDHVCTVLTIENEDGSSFPLYYRDTRRFGYLDFCLLEAAKNRLAKIQPDMMQISEQKFLQGMRIKNRTGIYSCIMNQEAVLSGVGNYIAAEALYRARLNPKAPISKLSDKHLKLLLHEIRAVCQESLDSQGMSVSDYVGIDNKPGSYQDLLQVYKKSEHKLKINGRTCYWDPAVQTIGK